MYLILLPVVIISDYIASQMWTLSRLLPVIVGNYINEDDDNWLHFLQLLDIMEYTFSPTVLSDTPAYLTMIISSNLTTYKELYPEFSFIPKMHYMVHIPQYLYKYVNVWNMCLIAINFQNEFFFMTYLEIL